MLKLLFVCFLVGLNNEILAQQEHVFKGTFEDCKKQAAKENKMILVDLYFEGCMPCKEMDEKVFPDPEVVKVLEPNFLLYKTDVFKEEDGKKLARKYAASGFPTYVILDASGKAILIEAGFFGVRRFVPLLEKAKKLKSTGTFLAFDTDMDKKYPDAYNYRFMRSGEKGDGASLTSFLQGKDLLDEVSFVSSTMVSSPEITNRIYDNLPQFLGKYGSSLLMNPVNRVAEQRIEAFGKAQQLDSFHETLKHIRPVYNERLWSVFLPNLVRSYYKGSKNAEVYLSLASQYEIFPSWAHRSNALGEIIIDQKDNPAFLKKLKEEYTTAFKTGESDITDAYKLSLICAYLGDFQEAKSVSEALIDEKMPYQFLAIKKEDVDALKSVIANKKLTGFQAKDVKKPIGFTMD